jgi:hypothetical protein
MLQLLGRITLVLWYDAKSNVGPRHVILQNETIQFLPAAPQQRTWGGGTRTSQWRSGCGNLLVVTSTCSSADFRGN